MLNKIVNHKKFNLYFLPILALIVFLTWLLNVNELINFIFYGAILITLAIAKVSNLTLIIFTLFTVAANKTPNFLESFDNLYFLFFKSNIKAIDNYHTFLYIGIFAITGIILLIRAIKQKSIPIGRLLTPMMIMVVYGIISLIWVNDLPAGMSEIWFFLQGYFIYVIVRNDQETTDKSLVVSWFLSLLLLVISLQYFVSYYTHYQELGLNVSFFSYWQEPGKAAIDLWANPNIVAAILGISLVPSYYKYIAKDRLKFTKFFIPIELLILYALYLTKSTGLYLSLFAGIIFIPLLFIKNRKVLFAIISAAIFLFVGGIAFIVYSEELYPNLYNLFNDFTTSRIDIYKTALLELKNPVVLIFGKGMGADRSILDSAHFFHSWVFQILITRGLVGFSLVVYMLYQVIGILFDNKDKIRYFIAIAVIIYLAHGITDSGFDYQHIGVIYYFLIATLEKRIPLSQELYYQEKGH